MKEKEVWKPVSNTGRYEVSNLGRIRSNVGLKQRILKSWLTPDGYFRVNLAIEKTIRKPYYVHRLMLLAFKPPPAEGLTADHIDRVRDNNALSNLRWATNRQNAQNRRRFFCPDCDCVSCTRAKTYRTQRRTKKRTRT